MNEIIKEYNLALNKRMIFNKLEYLIQTSFEDYFKKVYYSDDDICELELEPENDNKTFVTTTLEKLAFFDLNKYLEFFSNFVRNENTSQYLRFEIARSLTSIINIDKNKFIDLTDESFNLESDDVQAGLFEGPFLKLINIDLEKVIHYIERSIRKKFVLEHMDPVLIKLIEFDSTKFDKIYKTYEDQFLSCCNLSNFIIKYLARKMPDECILYFEKLITYKDKFQERLLLYYDSSIFNQLLRSAPEKTFSLYDKILDSSSFHKSYFFLNLGTFLNRSLKNQRQFLHFNQTPEFEQSGIYNKDKYLEFFQKGLKKDNPLLAIGSTKSLISLIEDDFERAKLLYYQCIKDERTYVISGAVSILAYFGKVDLDFFETEFKRIFNSKQDNEVQQAAISSLSDLQKYNQEKFVELCDCDIYQKYRDPLKLFSNLVLLKLFEIDFEKFEKVISNNLSKVSCKLLEYFAEKKPDEFIDFFNKNMDTGEFVHEIKFSNSEQIVDIYFKETMQAYLEKRISERIFAEAVFNKKEGVLSLRKILKNHNPELLQKYNPKIKCPIFLDEYFFPIKNAIIWEYTTSYIQIGIQYSSFKLFQDLTSFLFNSSIINEEKSLKKSEVLEKPLTLKEQWKEDPIGFLQDLKKIGGVKYLEEALDVIFEAINNYDLPPLHKIEYDFAKAYLNSRYVHKNYNMNESLRDKNEIIQELIRFTDCEEKNPSKFHTVLKMSLVDDFDELYNCSLIEIDDYCVIKDFKKGGWSDIYLIIDEGEYDDDFIKLLKVPNKNIHKNDNVERIISKFGDLETALKEITKIERRINSKLSSTSKDNFKNFEYRPIPQFFDMKQVKINEKTALCLIYEYIRGVDVDEYFKTERTRNEIISAFSRGAYSLNYIHSKGFIHNDLKGDNMLVAENGKVYLIDLAFSSFQDSETTKKGVRAYTAPERINGRVSPSEKSDQYAFGIMMYKALVGELPMSYSQTNGDKNEFSRRVALGIIKPNLEQLRQKTDENLFKIISRCISFNPEDRYDSMQQVEQELIDLI